MSRRLLAWSFGASCGYLIGWLAGSNVLRMAEGRRLARPGMAVRPMEARTPLPASSEPLEPGNGAQSVDLRPRYNHDGVLLGFGPIPGQRVVFTQMVGIAPEEMPCVERSPGGGLVCCRKGAHTSHLFEGSTARDRKDDADERIE